MVDASETDLTKRIRRLEQRIFPPKIETPDTITGAGGGGGFDLQDSNENDVVQAPDAVAFAASGDASVTVSDDGDGTGTVTYSASGGGGGVDVANSGGTVLAGASEITFTESAAATLTVSDDGDGTATVDVSASDTQTRARHIALPMTDIPDADHATAERLHVPTDKTLYVDEVGLQDSSGNAPASVYIEVYDHGAGSALVSQSTEHAEVSQSVGGATNVSVRVRNASGGSVGASGHALLRLE